jgi:hypothetical protein
MVMDRIEVTAQSNSVIKLVQKKMKRSQFTYKISMNLIPEAPESTKESSDQFNLEYNSNSSIILTKHKQTGSISVFENPTMTMWL